MYDRHSPIDSNLDSRLTPVVAAAIPLDFAIRHGVRLAVKGVKAAKARVDHVRYLRQANETAVQNATPRPCDVADAWQIPRFPRTPAAALILGDQLLAVDAPSAALHTLDETGRCHLSSRGGGLKEWLHHAAPSIPYSTAMRYRRLAGHLRRWLQLSPEIPLAWLFPTAPSPASLAPSAPLRRELARARRAFCELLADSPSLARLQRRLETDLGLLPARLDIPDFTSYRDLSGPRFAPPPPVPAPKWHPTQTLLELPRLSLRPTPTHTRRRRGKPRP